MCDCEWLQTGVLVCVCVTVSDYRQVYRCVYVWPWVITDRCTGVCMCDCRWPWDDWAEASTDGDRSSDVTHSPGNGSCSAEGRSCDGRHCPADGH